MQAQQSQQSRLRDRTLVQAIAESAGDASHAKDLDGDCLLRHRGAARLPGS
jgi:hypothetical protein